MKSRLRVVEIWELNWSHEGVCPRPRWKSRSFYCARQVWGFQEYRCRFPWRVWRRRAWDPRNRVQKVFKYYPQTGRRLQLWQSRHHEGWMMSWTMLTEGCCYAPATLPRSGQHQGHSSWCWYRSKQKKRDSRSWWGVCRILDFFIRSSIAINGAVPCDIDRWELEMVIKRIRTVQEPGANGWELLWDVAYSKSISNPERKSSGFLSSGSSKRILL